MRWVDQLEIPKLLKRKILIHDNIVFHNLLVEYLKLKKEDTKYTLNQIKKR